MRIGRRRLTLAGVGVASAIALTATSGIAMAGDAQSAPPQGTILGADSRSAIDGQYIVALRGDASDSPGVRGEVRGEATELATSFGAKVDTVYAAAFRGFAMTATESQAKKLAAHPDVLHVEADGVAKAVGEQPNPPSWGLDRVDGTMDDTFTYQGDASGVTAYVLDTGVDMTHPDFEGRATSGYDFIDDDADASDCNGHGTHVAGTVAGAEHGVAKGADIVSVRVLDCDSQGSWSQIIAGIDWVAENAEGPAIGNMSLLGEATESVDLAVENAIASGTQFAIAAGNEAQDACDFSPGRVEGAVTLGSTDLDDGQSQFSNYGSCLDLYAPGRDIISAQNGGGTTAMSGTSMATPHAAGGAALYLAANPDATPKDVRQALVGNADSDVVSNPGQGSPNLMLNISGLGGSAAQPKR